jgi:serine/threonine protein kinase
MHNTLRVETLVESITVTSALASSSRWWDIMASSAVEPEDWDVVEVLEEGGERIHIKKELLGSSDDGTTSVRLGMRARTSEPVAVKIESNGGRSAQVHNENHVLKLLRAKYPNSPMSGIPRLLAYRPALEGDSRFILVTEACGPSATSIASERALKDSELHSIAVETLHILRDLHSRGVVHRDVKPSNLMLPRGKTNFARGSDGNRGVRLIDFGLSEPYNRSCNRPQEATCTIDYASVGCLRRYPLSPLDDLEALGYTMLWLVFNRLPWQNDGTRLHPKGGAPDLARRKRQQSVELAKWAGTDIGNSLAEYLETIYLLYNERHEEMPYESLLRILEGDRMRHCEPSVSQRWARSFLIGVWTAFGFPLWLPYSLARKALSALKFGSDAEENLSEQHEADAHVALETSSTRDARPKKAPECSLQASDEEAGADNEQLIERTGWTLPVQKVKSSKTTSLPSKMPTTKRGADDKEPRRSKRLKGLPPEHKV